jgi:hypothetical protein
MSRSIPVSGRKYWLKIVRDPDDAQKKRFQVEVYFEGKLLFTKKKPNRAAAKDWVRGVDAIFATLLAML